MLGIVFAIEFEEKLAVSFYTQIQNGHDVYKSYIVM